MKGRSIHNIYLVSVFSLDLFNMGKHYFRCVYVMCKNRSGYVGNAIFMFYGNIVLYVYLQIHLEMIYEEEEEEEEQEVD